MDCLIVLAHPKPGSFNHAIAQAVSAALEGAGHRATVLDLCALRYDPLYTVAELAGVQNADAATLAHRELVRASDRLIFIHPNWWAGPPAILKGWLDRVLVAGVGYKFTPNGALGLLGDKKALVINTANTPLADEMRLYGDPLDHLWKQCVMGMCGVQDTRRLLFTSVIMSTPEQRAQWLQESARAAVDLAKQ